MIVCSCNALSDRDVYAHLANAAQLPRTVVETFHACGKAPQCGRCAPTLRCILRDIVARLERAPHDHSHQERQSAAA